MKIGILSAACLFVFSFTRVTPEKQCKRVPVSGVVTETRSYCGGARPSDEMLAELATPKPAVNKVIYIKMGEENSFDSKVILRLTTDEHGKFHAKLRPGKYLVVDSAKADTCYYNRLLTTYKDRTTNYEPIDVSCLKEWYLKPDGVFEVAEKGSGDIHINFQINCPEYLPCARYRGPFRE
jgi:hypothetical protein